MKTIYFRYFVIIATAMLVIAFYFFLSSCAPVNSEYMEGKVDRVEYIPGGFSTSAKTIIIFEDGRTLVCGGYKDILFPKGSHIKINRYCEVKEISQ